MPVPPLRRHAPRLLRGQVGHGRVVIFLSVCFFDLIWSILFFFFLSPPTAVHVSAWRCLCVGRLLRDSSLFSRRLLLFCLGGRGDWSIPEQATRAGEAIEMFGKFFQANL